MENISEQYGKCYKLFQRSELRFNQKFSKQMQLDELVDDTIDPLDSASQVTKASVTSNTSLVLKRIELERKKAELDSLEQLSLSRAKEAEVRARAKEAEVRARAKEAEVRARAKEVEVRAPAEEAEVRARAEEAEVRARAEEAEVRARAEEAEVRAKEAEVLAKLRIEKANIEAQEKILECSQQGSRVSRPSKT